jgi:hypothetical protein
VTSEEDASVGRGGLILPSSFRSATTSRGAASLCEGCEWQIVSVCVGGVLDNGCGGALVGCPPREFRMRVMRRVPPAATWDYVGDVCIGGGSQPVAVADAARAVRDRFVDLLPRPDPSYQPAGGALANLPTVFASGQREGVERDDFQLFAMPVQVEAQPSWVWDFGDGDGDGPGGGAALTTTKAGGRYPDLSVAHTYRRAGPRTVTVDTAWTGTFTVDGLGPFEVTGGPVNQRAELSVMVREAGGQLVGHP